ncbi:Phosphoribosyl transferase domain protein [Fulvivirga imtechensis AK7]|uniref:Phosphoribosyl transferase domain protein n=1 Tax=Fulvivirga imtechensis AK7 TaxID=1237149 RepID=L8JRW8_9BACT|nr:Phosphoribosyl transferase domain protein [Fulvivirga imtechensis AK7]
MEYAFPEGELKIPEKPSALIILCLGDGDSRFCPRMHFITQHLQRRGFATFIFDMLSREESKIYSFNPELAAQKLVRVTQSLAKFHDLKHLPVGYFGTSNGTAVALTAASVLKTKVSTVISCSGAPALAIDHLHLINIPVLLLAGQYNSPVVTANRQTLHNLSGSKNLAVILPGVSDLFAEGKTLEQVTDISGDWFSKNLPVKKAAKHRRLKLPA